MRASDNIPDFVKSGMLQLGCIAALPHCCMITDNTAGNGGTVFQGLEKPLRSVSNLWNTLAIIAPAVRFAPGSHWEN